MDAALFHRLRQPSPGWRLIAREQCLAEFASGSFRNSRTIAFSELPVTHGFDDKERVKQATDIVDLVSGYLQLRRQGGNYVATCPWHDDQRPSLQVNPGRQSWKCWVCDIGGDVFSFVMKRENIGFREALEMLAERSGISLTSRPGPKTVAGNPNDKPTLYKAMDWAARRYHECLIQDASAEPARRYLAARGITDNATRHFRIGFAPNSWSWLMDQSRQSGFSHEVLAACGLLASSERGGWYERFRGRLMFPIHDLQQRPIAFGGRILPEFAEQEQRDKGRVAAKYINSPESRLYSKSDHLFGLNIAREALGREARNDARHLIVVEGYTDVIAAWMAGLENVSAVCGTALNQRHIRLIRRFADRITLVLDGDAAGQRRTNEILEHFVAADVDLRIMSLPEGQDPCDFLQARGAADFRQRAAQARDALDHKIRVETEGIDLIRDTHAANQALERILGTVANSPASLDTSSDSRLRTQQILTRLSRQFQVDLGQLHRRVGELQTRRARRPAARSTAENAGVQLQNLRPLETELLQIVLRDNHLADRAIENISPDEFQPGPCREIFELLCESYHSGSSLNCESLMLQLEDPDLKYLLDRLDEESQAKDSTTEVELSHQLNQVIGEFVRHRMELDNRAAMSTLNQPEIRSKEEADILERMFQQAKERQGIR